MQRSRFPSWCTIRSKQLMTKECCLQIWLRSGRSANFRDFEQQFGKEVVARRRASLSCTLSPRDSTFLRLEGSTRASTPP